MADLHYFPLLAGDWLAGEAISLMTPEQEGAFIHLLCHCWNTNPPPSIHSVTDVQSAVQKLPCTLPNDDRALAQLSRLGRRWKSAGALVRRQFVEVDGDPTRIYNPKLWEIYQDALAAHDRRVAAGRAGGKAKARRYQSPSNARAMPKHSPSSQNQSHITTTTPAVAEGVSGKKSEPHTPPDSLPINRPPSWPAEGAELWASKVGHIAVPHFGKAVKPMVDRYGWEKTKAAMLAYIELTDRTRKVDWFVGEAVRWVALGEMPLVDPETGNLTERGEIAMKQARRAAS